MKVTCVEGRGSLGGTCLNVGCIPSKALLNSSHKYAEAKHEFAKYGVMVDNVNIDVEKMQAQKAKAVTGLTKGIEGLLKKNKVDYIKGWGKLASPNEVQVDLLDGGGSTTIKTKNILIATGSEVAPLPGVPIDEKKIVSSTGALDIDRVPKSLIVIGGGYIGLEMGSVWARLGTEVTVVEFLDNIVPTMDGEVRRAFQRSLQKQGFKFKLGTKVTNAEVSGETVKLTVEPAKGGAAAETLEADIVLVSTGRRPFTNGLNLEGVGVQTDERGRIKVDDHFQTTVPSIRAIGDVIPGPMLAHKAEEDGVAAAELMAGKAGHVNYDTVPSIVYTWPEVASVGKTEEQLKQEGADYKVGKFAFMANSRARTVDDAEGLVKMIADAKTDKILGVHIMGPNAGELIGECVLAMEYGASAEDIARTCHGHPTLSEAVKEAALATYFKAIHS
jgi:dihydrolipoamide dehydrogenase